MATDTAVQSFVPFRITVCGIDELAGFCEARVSHVLSILDPGHLEPVAFGAYGKHERLELRFHDIVDEREGQVAPQPVDVETLLRFGRDLLAEPSAEAHLLVHCHAGISRSTAAMTLLLAQARPDRPPAEALAEVVRVRPKAWPNLRMIEFGDTILGLGGALVKAVRDRHRDYARQVPEFAQLLLENGRAREVLGHG